METPNNRRIHIVIGKNFGDEGKGLAVDYFAMRAQKESVPCLVIRHNGGAQAGHTVDLKGVRTESGTEGSRFVFHQLSAGSFRGADTLWADTFLPDLYKLPEETEAFRKLSRGAVSKFPRIIASAYCRCVSVDDVLLNMALETVRGKSRHGSCGMGINEAVQRSKEAAFRLNLGEVRGESADHIFHRLRENRREYLPVRILDLKRELKEKSGILIGREGDYRAFLHRAGDFGELLRSENVLAGAAEAMCRAAELVEVEEPDRVLPDYGELVFEGAQGLLLDEEFKEYAPYLTTSRTGLQNPAAFLRKYEVGGLEKAEAVYVTRTYVTRHGAGPLPYEGMFDRDRFTVKDLTNIPNEWQGQLRFALHGTPEDFARAVRADLEQLYEGDIASLFLTHLNETEGMVCTANGLYDAKTWCRQESLRQVFKKFYCSETPYSEDVRPVPELTVS